MDQVKFGLAELGTYSTTGPKVNLIGTMPSTHVLAQLFGDGLTNGQTTMVAVYVDQTNWAVYSGAAYTTGSPNYLDLSGASLEDNSGSIGNGASVTVIAPPPFPSRCVTLSADPTKTGTGQRGAWGFYDSYVYFWKADNVVVRCAAESDW